MNEVIILHGKGLSLAIAETLARRMAQNPIMIAEGIDLLAEVEVPEVMGYEKVWIDLKKSLEDEEK